MLCEVVPRWNEDCFHRRYRIRSVSRHRYYVGSVYGKFGWVGDYTIDKLPNQRSPGGIPVPLRDPELVARRDEDSFFRWGYSVRRQYRRRWYLHDDPSGSNIVPLFQDENSINYFPQWSDDGQRVIWASDKGGNWGVWSMKSDGTGAVEIVNGKYGVPQGTIDCSRCGNFGTL